MSSAFLISPIAYVVTINVGSTILKYNITDLKGLHTRNITFNQNDPIKCIKYKSYINDTGVWIVLRYT